MGVTCQIFVKKPREGVHKAGRPVFGSVKYAIDEPTEYNEIILSLVGKGECFWSERRSNVGGHNHHQKHKIYKGTEVFLADYISILNKRPGLTTILPVGTYEYRFKFMLPENIPPSFKDSTCTIVYRIGLKFEKANFFSVHKKYTTEINVYGCVEAAFPEGNTLFGLEKSLLRPFSKRNHKINLKVDISNTIFSPGQNADISFAVTNNTDVKIASVKTELVCYTTYIANCGRKREATKVIKESTIETPSVPPDAVANMANVMPVLPHLYSIQNCRIMKKEYKVKVTLRLPMPYINASVELPIVIGEKRDDRNTEVAMFARQVPGPSVEGVESLSNGPPSYWEVMSEDLDEKEDKENDR